MTDDVRPIHVHFETDRFILRTALPQDASTRWAEWLADPVTAHMINLPPRQLSVEQLRERIASFDQYDNLLLGIFLLRGHRQIGAVRMRFIDGRKRVVPGVLIGEPEWRNAGVLQEIANATGTYFFETFGLQGIVAQVPPHNSFMRKYLEDREWRLVDSLPESGPAMPGSGGQLLAYELPRAVWLDRKRRGFFGGPGAHSDA
jgi:RimJ/RimL family protein N-acetyltransferase